MRKTRIICTIGPATNDLETMKELIQSGLNVARFNFSHGSHDSHREMANKMKQAANELNAPVALMLDTKGPEIRIKTFAKETVELKEGNKFTLTTREIEGDTTQVSVTHTGLPKDVKKGGRILIDDGLIELLIDNITETDVECTILNGGTVKNNKGINLPEFDVSLPSLTEKDINDIKFAIKEGFHFIAASFIRSADDVLQIRKILNENGGSYIEIMSKIENHQGVYNIDEILKVTDSIMVARGDLGVEILPEEVPLVQKTLIRKANKAGKPVVTATQMLESMISKPRPTRAETSDVANAIFDGTDGIMLSGETANGKYPVESVKTMANIAIKTEESVKYYTNLRDVSKNELLSSTDAIGYAASAIAKDIGAKAILALTESGFTARMISKFRPEIQIISITPNVLSYKKMSLTWGAIPLLVDEAHESKQLLKISLEAAIKNAGLKEKETVVIVSGMPVGITGTTNNIRVQVIGEEI